MRKFAAKYYYKDLKQPLMKQSVLRVIRIFANVVKLLIPGNFTFQFQTILRCTDSYVKVPKMAVL